MICEWEYWDLDIMSYIRWNFSDIIKPMYFVWKKAITDSLKISPIVYNVKRFLSSQFRYNKVKY